MTIRRTLVVCFALVLSLGVGLDIKECELDATGASTMLPVGAETIARQATVQTVENVPTQSNDASPEYTDVSGRHGYALVVFFIVGMCHCCGQVWARLKAPYHTCWIQRYPGLKAFLALHSSQYVNLKVEAYAQAPTLTIMSQEWDVVETIPIDEGISRVDMLKLLQRKGIS